MGFKTDHINKNREGHTHKNRAAKQLIYIASFGSKRELRHGLEQLASKRAGDNPSLRRRRHDDAKTLVGASNSNVNFASAKTGTW